MTRPTPLHLLRQAKHRAWVLEKGTRPWRRQTTAILWDAKWARDERRSPFQYHPAFYAHTFLARTPLETPPPQPVPRVIYACWFGGALTPARKTSIAQLRRVHTEADFRLVTAENLESLTLPGHPFHPAFRHLSPVHKSDYVRAYLMHFHGGGYTDVKETLSVWSRAFDVMDECPDVQAYGFREVRSLEDSTPYGDLARHLKRHHTALLGQTAFIMRPGSPLTTEWWRELNRRLDYYAPALAESPSPDNPYNLPAGYPLTWTELLADILHPLSLKHQESIVFDPVMQPRMWGHR